MKRVLLGWLAGVVLLTGLSALPLLAKDPNFDKAVQAARQGDWDEAAKAAQAAVNEDAKNAAAWSLLADAQINLGDTTAAVTAYQKSLSVDPKYPGAVLGLTRHYLRVSQIDAANNVVTAAEAKDPKGKSDEIKVARGMVLARQGQFAEARTMITSAAEKNPKNALYPWILARIYGDQNVLDLAEENYAKAWALDPGNAILAYEYGLVLQDQKKYNEALDLFKTVQEKDPSNQTVDYLIGRLYFAAKRYAEAAAQFEKAVEKRSDHFLSNLLLGRSYVELSKAERKNFYPHAVPYLRKAMDLRPERKDARAYLADALLNQSKGFFALATRYDSAPDDPYGDLVQLMYRRLIESADRANDKELADILRRIRAKTNGSADVNADSLQRAAREAAQEVPKNLDSVIFYAREALVVDSMLQGAHSQVARAFDKMGLLDSAAVHAEAEVRLQPGDRNELTRLVSIYQRQKKQASLAQLLEPLMQDSVCLSKFGLILVNALNEINDLDKAKALAQRIIAGDSSNCNAHQTYAYVLLKRERYREAIPVLQAGVKACPKDPEMWVQLGDSYYFSNEKSKQAVTNARDAYSRACQLGSGDGCTKKDQVETLLARPGLK